MFIVTVLLGAVFHLLDSIAEKIDIRLAILVIGVQVLNIGDLPVFTAFLGGGLGFAILLIFLLPVPQKRVPSCQ